MDTERHFTNPEVDLVAGPGSDAESPRPPHEPEEDLPGIADTPDSEPVPSQAPDGDDREDPEPDADPATSGQG